MDSRSKHTNHKLHLPSYLKSVQSQPHLPYKCTIQTHRHIYTFGPKPNAKLSFIAKLFDLAYPNLYAGRKSPIKSHRAPTMDAPTGILPDDLSALKCLVTWSIGWFLGFTLVLCWSIWQLPDAQGCGIKAAWVPDAFCREACLIVSAADSHPRPFQRTTPPPQ